MVVESCLEESEAGSSSSDVGLFREINRGLAKASACNKLLPFI